MEDLNTNVSEPKFTQEEVNDIVGKRLEKAEKKWQEKYANYFSEEDLSAKTEELNAKITELGNSLNVANEKATADSEEIAKRDKTIADLEAKLQDNVTSTAKIRIGLANGIPYELCDKLAGTTEEEIKADAVKMSSYLNKGTMPLRNPEANSEVDGVTKAFRELNPNIKI